MRGLRNYASRIKYYSKCLNVIYAFRNQGSRRGHNLNDSMSHYSRQSEDLGGLNPTTSGVNHTVQNLNPPPLDSINRSKNGSNLNLAVTTHPAPAQAVGGHQGKSDK